MSSSVSGCSASTSERDSSGETTENDGFSVVAATSSTSRSSTAPSSASCWVLENRCTSSMNSTVCCPRSRAGAGRRRSRRAAPSRPTTARTARRSAGSCRRPHPPARTARSRASVVFPVPGGPCSSTDAAAPPSTSRRSGAPGAQQVGLPDDLVERARAHPHGQRRGRRRPSVSAGGSGSSRSNRPSTRSHRASLPSRAASPQPVELGRERPGRDLRVLAVAAAIA